MRILVADDSVVSRQLLESLLRKWSYDVVVAHDGAEALRILEGENPPGIAVLDWMMPGFTGPDVCRQVRERLGRGTPHYTYILLLTAKGQREDLIEGLESGADDYLIKPVDYHELKARLRTGARIVELQRELVEAREALRDQATRDFLTRIWNRSAILEVLQREITRGSREGTSVGVVLADLDHFKQINDTFGHFAGDAVLCEFARRMAGVIRPYDSIGRYGGEEFLMILPGCDEACTARQSERMRAAISGEAMMIDSTPQFITCSFGATTWHPGSRTGTDALIRAADEALYRAKNQGRNRTVAVPVG